jgi:hypothetical protein
MVTRQQSGPCLGTAGTMKGHDHVLPGAGLDRNPTPVRDLLLPAKIDRNPENSSKLSNLHRKSFIIQFISNCPPGGPPRGAPMR